MKSKTNVVKFFVFILFRLFTKFKMHLVKQNFKCQDCIRPVARRLGLFQANDDYECYSESYVKCFWGLCDNQKSLESFAPKSYGPVITTQPQLQRPIKNMASKQMVLSK